MSKEVTMSPFTEKEIEYLHGQRLGRLATVDSGGRRENLGPRSQHAT